MAFPAAQTSGLVASGNLVALSAQASYTANNGDVVVATTASTALTVNLPPVAQGGPVTVRKVDAAGTGTVTVKTTDGSTVDGVAGSTGRAVAAASTLAGATLVSNGTNAWFTVAS